MKGLIRLDISSRIGTGHFQRMVNLADVMPAIDFTFLIKTDDPTNKLFQGHKVFFIGGDDLSELVNHSRNAHLIIHDLLHYRIDYIEQAKEKTGKITITFHEYNDYSTASDMAVNYNFFDGFEKKESSSFLAGPKYTIFNDTLLNTKSNTSDGIFVSFGGADPSGFTIRFIKEIANQLTEIPFNIHIGPFFSHQALLANLHIENNVALHNQPHNLYELMSKACMAVTAGGNMLYELIFLRKWSFALAHNAHQKEFALNAANYKACRYIGDKETTDWAFFRDEIKNAYMTPARIPAYDIDGQGKYRIAKKIYDLLH